jgi:hypothetical protein
MVNELLESWNESINGQDKNVARSFVMQTSGDALAAFEIYGKAFRATLSEESELLQQSDADLGVAYLSGRLTLAYSTQEIFTPEGLIIVISTEAAGSTIQPSTVVPLA